MPLSCKLSLLVEGETEFRGQLRSQTEFGNEGDESRRAPRLRNHLANEAGPPPANAVTSRI